MSDKDSNPFGSEPPDNPFGSPPSTDPFGRKVDESSSAGDLWARPANDQPAADPYAPAPDEAWGAAPPPRDPFDAPAPSSTPARAGGAIPALVLGIIGVTICGLCAPFAWALGRKAEQEIAASGGVLGGRGEAKAGKILGIVGCVIMVVGILALIALIALGASIEGGTETTTFQTFQ